uniref:class I tRNA ligase family protein n=1 Tax=uncultured Campylobacter sp. TaxID=218934 RepID=UPI00262DD910
EIETSNFTRLDRWILTRAANAFASAEAAFRNYDFSKGFNALLNFLSADLSGIYLDICKDRLYCDAPDEPRRRSAQSAIALITRALLPLIAPTLTYTIDEVMQFAPRIIKEGKEDVFDLTYKPIEFDDFLEFDEILIKSREKFFELIDALKKDKIIKSTLELVLQTSSNEILSNDILGVADWFMVSDVDTLQSEEALAEFKINDEIFRLVKSSKHKCPRCWKFNAKEPDELCPRCAKVMHAR